MAGRRKAGAGRWRHESQGVQIEAAALRLVAVADTHSRPHPALPDMIRQLAPSHILHAGDVGPRRILDDLAALAPVIAVRGNVDSRSDGLPDSVDLQISTTGKGVLKLLLTHIAVYGPRLRQATAQLARRHEAALIVCGHSHVPFIGRDKGLFIFNPGSAGPRRPPLPVTFGVLESSPEGSLQLYHLSCETGERWLP